MQLCISSQQKCGVWATAAWSGTAACLPASRDVDAATRQQAASGSVCSQCCVVLCSLCCALCAVHSVLCSLCCAASVPPNPANPRPVARRRPPLTSWPAAGGHRSSDTSNSMVVSSASCLRTFQSPCVLSPPPAAGGSGSGPLQPLTLISFCVAAHRVKISPGAAALLPAPPPALWPLPSCPPRLASALVIGAPASPQQVQRVTAWPLGPEYFGKESNAGGPRGNMRPWFGLLLSGG